MSDQPPPGLRTERLVRLVERSLAETALDLGDAVVVTEAATGAYAVTPVIAALAGATEVTALTRSTRFGTTAEVIGETTSLAEMAGVADRITVHDLTDVGRDRSDVLGRLIGRADVVTNSGHVRPIDAKMVSLMRPECVVPLMFEAWEIDLGRDDVDLDAMRGRGVRFAGTNERHRAVDVFSYLGPMLVKLLHDAAIAVYRSRILLVCDNPFMPYLDDGLAHAGATVSARTAFSVDDLTSDLDAIAIALKPRSEPVLSDAEIGTIAERSPGAVLAQFWGDIARPMCERAGVPCVPTVDPGAGHMGVLPSAVGPEPIVRLQAGGLKVASILRRAPADRSDDDTGYLDEL